MTCTAHINSSASSFAPRGAKRRNHNPKAQGCQRLKLLPQFRTSYMLWAVCISLSWGKCKVFFSSRDICINNRATVVWQSDDDDDQRAVSESGFLSREVHPAKKARSQPASSAYVRIVLDGLLTFLPRCCWWGEERARLSGRAILRNATASWVLPENSFVLMGDNWVCWWRLTKHTALLEQVERWLYANWLSC